jgi:E-phenylitaconyl-CoA hydratase
MPIQLDVEDHVATVTIDRPEVLNALDRACYVGLGRAWSRIHEDADIWVAVIRGAGDRSFTVGADLKQTDEGGSHAHGHSEPSPDAEERARERAASIPRLSKPVIAAVNGFCLGNGMALLLSADLRIASENATFGLSEVRHGLVPGYNIVQQLVHQIGFAGAMELLLTGDAVSAEEALGLGLINRVVPSDQLDGATRDMAARICRNAPLAVQASKDLAQRTFSMPPDDAERLVALWGRRLAATTDAAEGRAAFREKRAPVFVGR